MLGFSKKRFVITLGLSILVWIVSIAIQSMTGEGVKYGFFIFAKSCELTGYPLARCISEYYTSKIVAIYLFNIFFWFWLIHFFWNFFNRGK